MSRESTYGRDFNSADKRKRIFDYCVKTGNKDMASAVALYAVVLEYRKSPSKKKCNRINTLFMLAARRGGMDAVFDGSNPYSIGQAYYSTQYFNDYKPLYRAIFQDFASSRQMNAFKRTMTAFMRVPPKTLYDPTIEWLFGEDNLLYNVGLFYSQNTADIDSLPYPDGMEEFSNKLCETLSKERKSTGDVIIFLPTDTGLTFT